uniref:Uncharacterized protein n=1 Tax=Arundo donax TaxID=35708 RepID=A0A0A9T5K3_ARUDO
MVHPFLAHSSSCNFNNFFVSSTSSCNNFSRSSC